VKYIKKKSSEIDTNRLVVYGGSYGGFAVLSSLTEYPELWKGGVDIVGIANFVTFLQNTAAWRRKHREAEYGSLKNDMDTLIRISPINKIDNIKASVFIAHGDNDERVPLSETLQIHDKLKGRNLTGKLLRFSDEGHGITKLKNRLKLYTEILQWLKETI
jgi:dipeptidyl aminopeptidase/acylaminoacyl peptidase